MIRVLTIRKKATIEMQLIETYSKTVSTAVSGIRHSGKGVIMTKVSKNILTAHS